MGVKSLSPLRDFLVQSSSLLRDAVRVIDRAGVQACLVVNGSNQMVGMLSDGDVRRALLEGHSLESVVAQLMNSKFHFLRAPASLAAAEQLMTKHQIRHVPVLNDLGQVAELFALSDSLLPPSLPIPTVIMAGGKGLRLRPLTKETPKPMLLLGTRPLLEHVLDRCISAGLTNIYMSVNYLASQIRGHFGDGSRWGVTINYLEERHELGTAGALSLLPGNPTDVVVLNGDVLTEVNLRHLVEFHRETRSSVTVALREFFVEVPYGVVSLDGFRVQEIREKPSHRHFVNAGVYVLKGEVTNLVPPGQAFDMPDLIDDAIERGLSVSGFPLHEDWLDVGSFEALEQARGRHE